MSVARSDDGTTVRLDPDGDNWERLQALLDPATCVTLPPGTWPISRTLNMGLRTQCVQGKGVERTTLRLTAQYGGPVIGVGAGNRWTAGPNYIGAAGMKIRGLTLWQDSQEPAANCLYFSDAPVRNVNECDDFLVENIRVRGSGTEGIVAASSIHRGTLRNVEAWDCGNGAYWIERSTAGINATCIDLLLEDFRCLRCGQGVETGATNVTVRRGVVSSPGPGSPSIGINIGSASWGVYNTTVSDCIIDGYGTSLSAGSGNGRSARIYFLRNTLIGEDPQIQFFGGQLNNSVIHDDEGPSVYGSEIRGNRIHVRGPSSGVAGYNTGPADLGSPNVMGREPLLITGNTIYFEYDDQSEQGAAPIFYFAGDITGECGVYDNLIYGLDAAPARGDVQAFSNNANQAIPGMPNLTVSGNTAFNTIGRMRRIVVNREGA